MAQHDSLSTSGGLGLARLEGRLAESFFAPHTPTYGSKFQWTSARFTPHLSVKFPTMPPPEGWRLGDGLHPYYDTMLRRFHNHMCDMLEQWGAGLFQRRAEASDAVGSYKEYIIREYRKTWIQMFGIPDLKVSVDVQPSSVN
ncbi:hypothetical protein CIHG_09973 [Coccidioides immitis H538.4]|uniref:Uncharacterized protein n=1 Tax=Coccidioides immitis H538.4 TaxID=396776 RepID=A0A0J8S7D8_COCIT|nr:hypothetical protein CIHG_09973 [Coccidioides immitis H538.4]